MRHCYLQTFVNIKFINVAVKPLDISSTNIHKFLSTNRAEGRGSRDAQAPLNQRKVFIFLYYLLKKNKGC